MSKKWRIVLYLLAFLAFAWALFLGWPAWQILREDTASLSCFCPSCPETSSLGEGIATFGQIQVEVAGAVENPGIYALKIGQRHADAITLAGGFQKEADQEFLAKQYNLADQLSDGEKIYIPFQNESETEVSNDNPTTQESSATTASSCISINQASQSDLESLSGIGSTRASNIIAGRPYSSLEDLKSQEIITTSIFDAIAAEICL